MNLQTTQRMSTPELVALIAMLFSTVAFSVDAMLPAFPKIATDLDAHGSVHLVMTLFMGGLAVGMLIAGPLSDAWGRKSAMYAGALLYIVAGLVAWLSESFEVVVAARFFQGLGAAGPRVVSLAIVRDLYQGAQMARIISFAMVIFTIVPTIAPTLGYFISMSFGWRAIMLAFVVFSILSTLWLWLRLDEPLAPHDRRSLHLRGLAESTKEILKHRVVFLAILLQGIALGLIMCMIVQVQAIYEQVFDRASTFPYWFGGIALFSATSTSLVNAALVGRFGMRRLVTLGMAGQAVIAAIALTIEVAWPQWAFPTFVVWQFLLIWLTGLCVGNLSSIAMEPMGHVAGLAASLSGAIATFMASILAMGAGYLFNGTVIPLLACALVLSICGVVLMRHLNARASGLSVENSV